MDKIRILVACHKPCNILQDPIYTPIHVGRAVSKYKEEMSGMIGDDTGDNISVKNPMYSEMTAQYWAWKNLPDVEYIGFCHYRRYFKIKITKDNVDSLFKNHDVIMLGYRSFEMIERTAIHSISYEDIAIFLQVLKKMYPEYEKTAINHIWSNRMHKNNMLICKKELFDKYAEWFFGLADECEKYIRLSPYSRARRVYAYLAEFFMPLYFIHNHYRIYNTRYIGFDTYQTNDFKDGIKDLYKNICYTFIRLFVRKPRTIEDYINHAVLNGLMNDNIIING